MLFTVNEELGNTAGCQVLAPRDECFTEHSSVQF